MAGGYSLDIMSTMRWAVGVSRMREGVRIEAKSALELARRDLEIERDVRERDSAALLMEREKANNLQSVLEDFQAGTLHTLL